MIEIRNTDDLIKFCSRKDVSLEQAEKALNASLKVIHLNIFKRNSKEEFLKLLKEFIAKWCNGHNGERPLFLEQINLEFNINDVYEVE
jgi:hypothetical protein